MAEPNEAISVEDDNDSSGIFRNFQKLLRIFRDLLRDFLGNMFCTFLLQLHMAKQSHVF